MYTERSYRKCQAVGGLLSYEVKCGSTDLFVMTEKQLGTEIYKRADALRNDILSYSVLHPDFLDSLVPIDIAENAPEIVRRMALAAEAAGVGPMAAVAGGIAEMIGESIAESSAWMVIENGGDIYLKLDRDAVFSIFAGHGSPFSGLKIRTGGALMPAGLCTSSGRIGPSLSFGDADAACILAENAFLADACATQAANLVSSTEDIQKALEFARRIKGVRGAVIIRDDKIGIWGELEITG